MILIAKRVGVCADDFGMTSAVNDAVVDLAWRARITATSCLVDAPAFVEGAPALIELHGAGLLDVGLHLNLTECFADPWPRWSLPRLVLRAYTGRLDAPLLRKEVRRQLDRFERVLGFTPDHVDGHQHVHQLPGVRDVLLPEVAQRYGERMPWVRNCRPAPGSIAAARGWSERVRALAIAVLGARGLHRLLTATGMLTNHRLLGVYSHGCKVEDYLESMELWMREAHDGDLLMCHPATAPTASLVHARGRDAEYRVLGSSLLPSLLEEHRVALVRLSQWAPAVARP